MLRVCRARSVRRAVDILTARAQGATQAEVASALNVSVRSVRRYEAAARRGTLPPTDAALEAAFALYRQERSARVRAALLMSIVRAAAIETQFVTRQVELKALRLAGGA